MFNFEVNDWHTYFVGSKKILVHNTGPKGICLKSATKEMFEELGKKLPCFPAGTMVHTPRGKVPIDLVQEGMSVWAYDVATKNRIEKRISGVYKNATKQLVNIRFENNTLISATRLHRFWVADKTICCIGMINKILYQL